MEDKTSKEAGISKVIDQKSLLERANDEKATEEARKRVHVLLKRVRPDLRVTFSLPDGMIACTYVEEGETPKQAIEKFIDHWWSIQASKTPELFENNRLRPCPKCGGELEAAINSYNQRYYRCTKYPYCNYHKVVKR